MTVVTDAPESAVAAGPAVRKAPRTRADALRNRERIVAAAREMFVEYGPEAPLDEIARRAGIGNATLYRHFADRQALLHDVLLSVMGRTMEHAERVAVQHSDPFTALRDFAHMAVDERVGALCGMLVGGPERDCAELAAKGERLEHAVEALMERARQAGQLRPDVTVGDLLIALSLLTRPLPGLDCPNVDEVAHRHLQLFLDGLRSSTPSELPGTATVLEDLRRRAS
ncbi:transcriptional regulator, TetR family [Actinacidiphila alni]|uniref:Transcriptional regulator, TetR family n=1 Tax=Actinacidiphila alni TaxID=380248 RepID=A0A1I2AH60_9ACTN|nr:transcriptional regulator, TetR family [Actinacidiphila alni]